MSTLTSYTNATRPSASSNSGLCIFNTDDNQIQVSDGTDWLVYNYDLTTANGLSLEFDGGDRLDTSYSMTAVQSFTCMFWMKSSNTSNTICMLADNDRTTGAEGNISIFRLASGTDFYLGFTDINSSWNSKTTVTNFNSLFDGSWHHVAVVFDSSGTYTNVTIYKDGSQAVSQDARTANGWANDNKVAGNSKGGFTFGGRYSPTYGELFYTGKMDQMAFFEIALTSTNISDIYNSGNGGDLMTLGFSPSAYYRVGYYLEDTNSDSSNASAGQDIGTVADYSGNNNDASQSSTSLKPNYVADVPWS
jgi:hypothetical protein